MSENTIAMLRELLTESVTASVEAKAALDANTTTTAGLKESVDRLVAIQDAEQKERMRRAESKWRAWRAVAPYVLPAIGMAAMAGAGWFAAKLGVDQPVIEEVRHVQP